MKEAIDAENNVESLSGPSNAGGFKKVIHKKHETSKSTNMKKNKGWKLDQVTSETVALGHQHHHIQRSQQHHKLPSTIRHVDPNSAKTRCSSESETFPQKRNSHHKQHRPSQSTRTGVSTGTKAKFEAYWDREDIQRGLKRGELIQGVLRINPKNFEDSYVPHPDGKSDVFINGMVNRNRALNGDEVVIQIFPRNQWKVLLEELHHERDTLRTTFSQLSLSQAQDSSDPLIVLPMEGGAGPLVLTERGHVEFNLDVESDVRHMSTIDSSTDDVGLTVEGLPIVRHHDPSSSTDNVGLTVEGVPVVRHHDPISSSDDVGLTVEGVPVVRHHDPSSSTDDIACSEACVEKSAIDDLSVTSDNATGSDGGSLQLSVSHNNSSPPVVCAQFTNPKEEDVHRNRTQIKDPPSKNGAQQYQQQDNKRSGKNRTRGGSTPNHSTPVAGRFTSLGDMGRGDCMAGSPEVKQLFKNDCDVSLIHKKLEAVPDHLLLRTGKVVFIADMRHSRACTGYIRPMKDNNPDLVLFSPVDYRLPRIYVPATDCPAGFLQRPDDFKTTLFIARITVWDANAMFASGRLAKSLGEAGDIGPETEGMLIEHDIEDTEFTAQVLECLPKVSPTIPWSIPAGELHYRRDFRDVCVFTIDPATARDLDDALHCIPLGNDVYEVGVHIADVSYFVNDHTALDSVAASRATSVYLVQKVIPMLPRLLCEQLCSLNPDEDRLTFSVVWRMTKDGEIIDDWFGRSVIRSCVKLAYEHAQGFIENPERDWREDELPPISRTWSSQAIKESVLNLHKIAQSLRSQRYRNGALTLNQVKLQYVLDRGTGLPCGYSVYLQKDSNKLVEEFMLLANMSVAHKIYTHYPAIAVLRRHPAPQSRMIDELVATCKSLGVPIDGSSSKSLQSSLNSLMGPGVDAQSRMQIMTVLCSRPMQFARYFCTSSLEDVSEYRHYALSVPFYTHFTSPIRRYPDIMVHRLLAAALGYRPAPVEPTDLIQQQCDHCNNKKLAAKRVSELSSEMFFAVFVKECGPLEEQGMVMTVLDKSVDVLILRLGVVKRIYMEKLNLKSFEFHKLGRKPVLTLLWAATKEHAEVHRQELTIFTPINCLLVSTGEPLKWNASLKHPDEPLSSRNTTQDSHHSTYVPETYITYEDL